MDSLAVTKDELREVRKLERQKENQRLLNILLDEVKPDWEQVRGYMYMPDLNPNYTCMFTQVTTAQMAASDGETDVLRWCINRKADINARSAVGRCALHQACANGRANCIRLLLENRADVNTRSLSYQSPVHLACQYNAYDAVLILLHESNQIIDIDAEDMQRKIPEAYANDKKILRAFRNYRLEFDERRKKELMETALRRVFDLFDTSQDGFINPEEWAESQCLFAQHFEQHDEDAIEQILNVADKNRDGLIDWPEFKAAHEDIICALGVPFQECMNTISEIENIFFKQKVALKRAEEDKALKQAKQEKASTATVNDEDVRKAEEVAIPASPVVSVRARQISAARVEQEGTADPVEVRQKRVLAKSHTDALLGSRLIETMDQSEDPKLAATWCAASSHIAQMAEQ